MGAAFCQCGPEGSLQAMKNASLALDYSYRNGGKTISIYHEQTGEFLDITDRSRWESGVVSKGMEIYIRTFGSFEVFLNGNPVYFSSYKAKELLAYLVNCRGGMVPTRKAVSVLWEDEPVSQKTLNRYYKVCMRLRRTLEKYGIEDILKSVPGGGYCIVMDKVRCDYYDYLSRKPEAMYLYKGVYMSDYSWSEETIAELERFDEKYLGGGRLSFEKYSD